MSKILNILSIDFDFFQNVSEDTIVQCFPDGHDLGNDLARIVWAGHYGNPRDHTALLHIKPKGGKIVKLQKIIKENSRYGLPNAMIANSHAHIYNAIADEKASRKCDALRIVNIDMHHDMFDDKKPVTCGNWATHILKENPGTSFTWICHKISKKLFPCSNPNIEIVEEDLDILKNTHWDMIFLCRSDIWTPPHLDPRFINLANTVMRNAEECRYEPTVLDSRYDTEFIRYAETLRDTFKKMWNQP